MKNSKKSEKNINFNKITLYFFKKLTKPHKTGVKFKIKTYKYHK